jgi:putative cell wall-binding protein
MAVNGKVLDSSEAAYAIGEDLRAANTQDYVSVSHDQNDEVELVDSSSGNSYFAVYGGYRSPWITVTNTEGNTVTLQFPSTETDTLKYADSTEFEVQLDGEVTWTEVLPDSTEATEAKLTLQGGHEYTIRAKLTHKSYVEAGDPIERTLITYSNPVSLTAPSSDSGIDSILSLPISVGTEAGTRVDPKTASISVANSVSAVAVGDIMKSHAGATVTFYGTDSGFTTPRSGAVSLAPGADTAIYFKVTAQDVSTVRYFAITIKRAASSSTPTPNPTPGPGTIETPAQGPVEDKVERITVDVKQGDTDNTVSKISIDRTTHADGSKSDMVTYQQEKARETIEKLQKEGKDIARILIPSSNGAVSRTQVIVPSSSLSALTEGKVNLHIDTEDAKIEISKASLAQADQKLDKDLFFHLVPVKKEEEKHEVTQRAIFEVGIIRNNETNNISALGIPMTIETNMPSADVDITLPLSGISIPADSVEREAFLRQLAVFIEHSDGEKELVQGEIVEYRPGVLGIKFHIKKFSTFTIVKLERSAACDVIKVTVPAKATIKGSKITATVENTTKKLTVKVTVSDKASWKLYSDRACSKELKGQKLTLKVGANKVYLKTLAEDGYTSKIYTVTITRRELAKQLIIIANKYDFADAFVGGVPALQSGGEVITTGIEPEDAKRVVNYIKKNYAKHDKIYILGLEKAINKDLEKWLNKEGYTDVVRIGGKDKYETAKKTAGIVKLSEKVRVVLVNGTVMPEDAESIQKVCADKGYPILLVQKNNLTTSTLEALKEIKPTRVYILGDQTTVSAKIAEQVSKALKLKNSNVIRIKSGKEIK